MNRRRLLLPCWGASLSWALSACAPLRPVQPTPQGAYWRGRLSLTLDESPPQHLLATFELSGNPQEGQLLLSSPLGNVLARVDWNSDGATLQRGDQRQQANSLSTLLQDMGIPSLPLLALFDWLDGRNTNHPGWDVDLSQHAAGRLSAVRNHPSPQTRLRLMLEP